MPLLMIFVMIVVVKQTIGVTISTSGGYENIVIKLSQDLEQEHCSDIISSLKVCISSSDSTFYIFPSIVKHSSITKNSSFTFLVVSSVSFDIVI